MKLGQTDLVQNVNIRNLGGTDMMNSVTAVASSQDTRAIPESLRKTIDATQATATELRSAVEELRAAGIVANVSGATEKANQS